ncbi:MAG: putative PAS/PAC sensor [Geobacteraceae bacterium]|nr:MAG: putative PAS/PAC sensor [Geobacteraceae bacterium]
MEEPRLRLLLVTNEEDDYTAIWNLLSEIRGEIELERLSSYDAALQAMGRNNHDVYLIECDLGKHTGLELLHEAAISGCKAPTILIASRHDRQADMKAIKGGAADYLVMGELNASLLERSIRYALERKEVEKALIRSEDSLAKAQQIAHVGNWDWNIQTNELHWSDEVYRILGLYPQGFEATYEAFLRAVHPDDRGLVNRSVNAALYAQKNFTIEHRIVLPSGVERIVHQQGEATCDETGNPLRMLGTVQDITVRRRAEDALRLMEEKFSKAFHASPDWIVMSSVADGRYIEVNDAFLNITGYTRKEVIGRSSAELGIWAESDERVRMLKLLDEHGLVRNLEAAFRMKSGEIRYMLWSADVIVYNGEACLIAVARDMTEQRELEHELLESQVELYNQHEELTKLFSLVEAAKKEWETTMDHIGDMVILADGGGNIRRCNRAFQEFMGVPYGTIIGAEWVELLHEHELITGTIYLQSLELYHNPTGRWFVLSPYPFTNSESGEISGYVITIHDATELKQASEKLEKMNMELEQAHAKIKETEQTDTPE